MAKGSITRASSVAVLAAAMLLAGCEVEEALQAGRAAMAADRPVEARGHFERALELKPELAEHKKFAAAWHTTRRDAACREGQTYINEARYEAAIERFEYALELDPNLSAARDGLTEAHRLAARRDHKRALAAADEGDLQRARGYLESAVAHDPSFASAESALASIDSPFSRSNELALDAYEAGLIFQEQKRWPDAAEAFKTAVERDKNLLPSRAALLAVRGKISDRDRLIAEAREKLRLKLLDEARDTLIIAKAIAPHSSEVARLQQTVRERRAASNELTREGQSLYDAGQWHASIAKLREALDIFPNHPEARPTLQMARQAGAEEATETGEGHIQAGNLDAAAQSFEAAFDFVPQYEPARFGLAEVATTRGNAAAKAGLWGSAMLFYMDAHDRVQSDTTRAAVNRARGQIRKRVAFTISVPHDDFGGIQAGDGNTALAAALRRQAPSLFTSRPQPGERTYSARLAAAPPRVDRRMTRRERREHFYDVRTDVPNPDIPKLEALVNTQEHRTLGLQARYDAERERAERAEDRARRLERAAKRASNHRRDDDRDDRKDGRRGKSRDDDRRSRSAGNASREAARAREDAREADRRARRIKNDLDRARRELRHLRSQLACAPTMVTIVTRERWPYVREHWEQRVELCGTVSVGAPDGSLTPTTLERTHTDRDTAIQGANPAIGLREDLRELANPAAVERDLLSALAADSAKRVIDSAGQREVQRHRDAANAARRNGDVAGEVEARIDAIVTLDQFDAKAAKRELEALREGR